MYSVRGDWLAQLRGTCDSWSWGGELESHLGCRDDFKKLKKEKKKCAWWKMKLGVKTCVLFLKPSAFPVCVGILCRLFQSQILGITTNFLLYLLPTRDSDLLVLGQGLESEVWKSYSVRTHSWQSLGHQFCGWAPETDGWKFDNWLNYLPSVLVVDY